MNEAIDMQYTVIMRPGTEADEALLAGVRAALERVEGVCVAELTAPVVFGMNRREAVLTALITYSVTVAANLSSAAIQARFQEALSGSPDTSGVVIEEVLADGRPPADAEGWVEARALEFADEAEAVLGIDGLASRIREEAGDVSSLAATRTRLDVGDIGSVAGAVIALLMWIDQIRRGQVLKRATRDEIASELCARVLETDDLPPEAKERLVAKALDRFLD